MSKLILKEKKAYRKIFPRPSDEVYGAMREDIKVNGQHAPIYHNKKGIILDGYTRYDIIRDLKIEPITKLKNCIDEVDEIDFIMSMNSQRRDLSVGQKILAYEDYYEELKRIRKNHYKLDSKGLERSQYVLAKKVGCGHSTVGAVYYVLKHGNKKDIQQLKNGGSARGIEGKIRNRLNIKNEKEFVETSTLTLVNNSQNKQRIPCPECGGTGQIII